MTGFLNSYSMAVGAGQLRGVLRLAEKLRSEGLIRNDEELRMVVEELRGRLTNRPSFEPAINPVRIKSSDINSNFEQIYVDLFGLYTHIERMDNTVTSQQEITSTLRQQVRKAIHRLSQDTRQFLFLRDNPEYTEVKFVDFADTRNRTTDRLKAVVDEYDRSLRLPQLRRDRHNELRGIEETTLDTEILTNGAVSAVSKSYRPEFALDQNNVSFWAEVLLTDDIVKTTYQTDQGIDVTVDGVVVKATVKLDKPQFVNNIQILPYSPYPMTILDIRFDGVSWDGFQSYDPTFDWMDFTGLRKVAESIEIYFHQENYSLVNYQVPGWAYNNSFLWDQIIDKELEDRYISEAQIPLDIRESLTSPGLGALVRARSEFEDIFENRDPDTSNQPERVTKIVDAIVEVLDSRVNPVVSSISTADTDDGEKKQGFVEIDKVEYVLGAFSIVVSDIQYATQGRYESPRFAVVNNPVEIELETEDRHITATGEGNFQLTSLEYSVSLGPETFLPIIPVGVTGITQEFIDVDPASRSGFLRFDPDGAVTIYGNQSELTLSSNVGSQIDINTDEYSPDILYTADYTPLTGQTVIDVEATLDSKESIEYFTETDKNGAIQLRYYPHIIYDIVNDTDRWNRPDSRQGIWTLDPEGSAQTYDGFSYGFATGVLLVTIDDDDTNIPMVSATDFPTEGTVEIDSERMTYEGITGASLLSVVRGVIDTEPVAHISGSTVSLITQEFYEPVKVFVNGLAARNISDYRLREHPAFAAADNMDAVYEFIQIGRTIYLNKPVENATIEIQYRYIAEYVSGVVLLRNHQLGNASRTPIVDRFNIRMKTESR